MPVSEQQKAYAKKYHKEKTDELKLRLPKGRKTELQTYAASKGESLNKFVVTAIDERITRDTASTIQKEEPAKPNYNTR